MRHALSTRRAEKPAALCRRLPPHDSTVQHSVECAIRPLFRPTRHAIKHALLVVLFLLAQFGALAHGVKHALEPAHDAETVCELCLAYTPLGAGIVGSLPAWQAPMFAPVFNASIPLASPAAFRATYQSRAPPLAC